MSGTNIKIYKNDELLHDCTLCKDTNGRIGWWDAVDGKFHYQEEEPAIREPMWAQYIDTGVSVLKKQDAADTNVGNEWISVEERLPERGESVLILCKNKAKFTGYWLPDYSGEARWRVHTALNSAKLLNKGRVTHWMPLPEAPKEG